VNPPTLSHCRELRELELYAAHPAHVTETLIASIVSTNLQRIVFSARALAEMLASPSFVSYHSTMDNSLCQLVDRLQGSGYKVILEVVFQTRGLGEREEELDLEKLLPKFQEKGRVRIARMSSGTGVDYRIGR